MIYVTSDLHGYAPERFFALLEKAGFGEDDYLFILGDVIDRNGDGGVALLKWLLVQPNVQLLRGNHEDMLLACDFLFDEVTEESLERLDAEKMKSLLRWQRNGAQPTIDALHTTDPEMRNAILEYLREAPLCDMVSVGGRDFFLVHGGLGNYEPHKRLRDYTAHDLLWTRPSIETRYSELFITVIGHTPTQLYGTAYADRMIVTDTWINIDTGAAFGRSPMLLRLDDLQPFYADEA